MPVIKNIGFMARCLASGAQADIHPQRDAALVWEHDKICWAGEQSKMPGQYSALESFDAKGALLIPGLIDCHTHLAFSGWRADEFEMRIQGKSYLEIAAAGGGILSTVAKTRAASAQELIDRCHGFIDEMLRLGVTTVECKSGYGLDLKSELKLLHVYKKLGDAGRIGIVPTLLGAHSIPAEFKDNRERYLEIITAEMIPHVAAEKLARFCDVFLEEGAFSYAEAEEILTTGIQYGLIPKIHADQLSHSRGAELAAELKAASADHLEHVSAGDMRALADNDVVAVLLPVASLYTAQKPASGRKLVKAGAKVAVATDFNPGTAPTFHLPMALMLACTINQLTPDEALKGATIYAARALRMESEIGSLEAGKAADFALIDAPDVAHWLYHFRPNACRMTVRAGKVVHRVAS